MKKKQIIILILLLAVLTAVSGCWKKQQEPVINNNTEPIATTTETQTPPEEIINYLEDGEIDTSDWFLYKNSVLGIKIKYPTFLYPNDYNSNFKQRFVVFRSRNVPENKNFDPNWDIFFGHSYEHLEKLDIEEKKIR